MNTLHNWFLPKQQHSDERSQESTCIHPEARSNTDTDLMQIDGPTTAEETHSDKAQTHTEDTHTKPEDDDNPHMMQMQIDGQGDHQWDSIFFIKTIAQWKPNFKCSTCHAGRNRGSRMRVRNIHPHQETRFSPALTDHVAHTLITNISTRLKKKETVNKLNALSSDRLQNAADGCDSFRARFRAFRVAAEHCKRTRRSATTKRMRVTSDSCGLAATAG